MSNVFNHIVHQYVLQVIGLFLDALFDSEQQKEVNV